VNAYEQGVSHAIGFECNIGTLDQLFFPANYKNRVDGEYIRRKLSSFNVAELLKVHPNTVNKWAREGKLPGKKSGKRQGWRKWQFWRFSLKDIEDFILNYSGKKDISNAVQYCPWTPQEEQLLKQGVFPEGRTPKACYNRRYRCTQST